MASVRSVRGIGPHAAAFVLSGWEDQPRTVTYTSNVELDPTGAAWLPALLPILMRRSDRARFDDRMDRVGLANAELAQDVLARWYPHLHRVPIEAVPTDALIAPSAGVGCFFSGGVDSFYSVLAHLDEITHLIFVHGFDIRWDDDDLAARAIARARAAADELERPLIVVHTDVRRLSDPWSGWAEHYHGAALASVGHLLAGHVGRVIIPSTYHQDELFPWGSHPELDPLWSTSRVAFEHDGVDLHRTDKIGAIASNPVAMRYLRVCWENWGGDYNCGRCEKCVRTMIGLRAYDALTRCATLPSQIDPLLLRAVRKPTHGDSTFARDNLAVLASHGVRDPRLERELKGVVRREALWRAGRAFKARVRAVMP